ncbi:1752_t:CDS:1 [Racocetra persica]|uniref:1752_t:CDS:1 n=1 Tax=Racocetra persica TaxID=160502 RepID=A0ACA9M5I4_9GLOM|nr:1752_t:CDS:1 [Racocetra persica]
MIFLKIIIIFIFLFNSLHEVKSQNCSASKRQIGNEPIIYERKAGLKFGPKVIGDYKFSITNKHQDKTMCGKCDCKKNHYNFHIDKIKDKLRGTYNEYRNYHIVEWQNVCPNEDCLCVWDNKKEKDYVNKCSKNIESDLVDIEVVIESEILKLYSIKNIADLPGLFEVAGALTDILFSF